MKAKDILENSEKILNCAKSIRRRIQKEDLRGANKSCDLLIELLNKILGKN